MTPDYYAVLGVARDADRDALWSAYRRRAAQCHPDCGGSHRDMVLLNEAWSILADPVTRARYDESFRRTTSLAIRQAFEQDQQQARAQAEQYPRRWSEFERWLDEFAHDVHSAQFGMQEGIMGIPFPVVSNSRSAAILIGTGAVIGVGLSLSLTWYIGRTNLFFHLTAAAIIGTSGAWFGYYLHDHLGRLVPQPAEDRSDGASSQYSAVGTSAAVVVSCRRCGQRLRFPRLQNRLQATCPRCKEQFELPPAA